MAYDYSRSELIFDAIENLLLEEGRESLTYAKISERCHLHTNTITYYFNGKEDMMIQFFQHIVNRDSANMPEFFTSVPGGLTPVEAFNNLIDYIVEGGHLMSKTRRLLNLYLLPYVDISDAVKNLLSSVHNASSAAEYAAIQMYKDLGIIEESRIREAFADLTLASSGYSLILLFGVQCLDHKLALHHTKERLRKSFLRDEFYQKAVYRE